MEMWTREFCECKAENFIYLGRDDNITQADYDGYECWNCKKENLFPIPDGEEKEDEEEYYFAEGRHYTKVEGLK